MNDKLIDLIDKMANGYVNYLYADNGAGPSTSHIYLINTLKAIPTMHHDRFNAKVTRLCIDRDRDRDSATAKIEVPQ